MLYGHGAAGLRKTCSRYIDVDGEVPSVAASSTITVLPDTPACESISKSFFAS